MSEDHKVEEVKVEEVKVEEVKEEHHVDEVKVEEVKVEDVKVEDVKVEEEKTLIKMLALIIINETVDDKINIKLDKKIISVIRYIINTTPKIFDEIEENIKVIVDDGVINSKDIPAILLLLQNLYELIYSFKNTKLSSEERADICAVIAKLVLHMLVEENLIKIKDENKKVFLDQMDGLIDVAIRLVRLPHILKPKGCFKKLFGKK